MTQAAAREQPESLGERLGVALAGVDVPRAKFRPWTKEGWICKLSRVSRQALDDYLDDRAEPTLSTIRALSQALGVNPGWLAFGILPVRPARRTTSLDQFEVIK